MLATAEELASALVTLAAESSVDLDVIRSTADGFGGRNVPILDVSIPRGARTRVWEEGGRGDFLFEVGAEHLFGGWWRQRSRRQSLLPRIVLDLAHRRYEVVEHRLTVQVHGQSIALRDQM